MQSKIQLEDVLNNIGFVKESDSWEYDFGNFKINAYHCFDPFEVFHFYGFYIGNRSAQEFEFKISAKVDSYEQGVALVAYYFRKEQLLIKPAWLEKGLQWEEELPWRKEWAIQAKKEADRREFSIKMDYEWFKVLVRKIKSKPENNNSDSTIRFSFDGELLRVQYGEQTEVLVGTGKPWKDIGIVSVSEFSKLPKRIMRHHAEIILHRNKLYICNVGLANLAYEIEQKIEKQRQNPSESIYQHGNLLLAEAIRDKNMKEWDNLTPEQKAEAHQRMSDEAREWRRENPDLVD